MADDDDQTKDEADQQDQQDQAGDQGQGGEKDQSDGEGPGEDQGGSEADAERSDNDDPSFGKKDDEPANETQMAYMRPLAEDLGEDLPDVNDMSEAEAAEKINEMQDNASGA